VPAQRRSDPVGSATAEGVDAVRSAWSLVGSRPVCGDLRHGSADDDYLASALTEPFRRGSAGRRCPGRIGAAPVARGRHRWPVRRSTGCADPRASRVRPVRSGWLDVPLRPVLRHPPQLGVGLSSRSRRRLGRLRRGHGPGRRRGRTEAVRVQRAADRRWCAAQPAGGLTHLVPALARQRGVRGPVGSRSSTDTRRLSGGHAVPPLLSSVGPSAPRQHPRRPGDWRG
jgi:hypothetical protein